MDFEWRSVNGLLASKGEPVRRIKCESDFELWSTCFGQLWTPFGATQAFVAQVVAEMNALVYDFSSLRNNGAGCTIVDAGANIGAFALWALRFRPKLVICFEPSPQNAACLRKNLAVALSMGSAHVIERGLWDSTGTVSFNTMCSANPGAHHIADNGQGNLNVPVVSLDDIFSDLGVDRIDYIKMDIEGAEQRAIRGAREVVKRFRPELCIATEHTADPYANTLGVIQQINDLEMGYSYRVTEAHAYPSPSFGRVMTPYSILFTPRALDDPVEPPT